MSTFTLKKRMRDSKRLPTQENASTACDGERKSSHRTAMSYKDMYCTQWGRSSSEKKQRAGNRGEEERDGKRGEKGEKRIKIDSREILLESDSLHKELGSEQLPTRTRCKQRISEKELRGVRQR